MCALPVIGTDSSSGVSASYLNQLIDATMTQRKQPLTAMTDDRDALEIKKGVYTDLSRMLSTLKTQAQNLQTGSTYLTGMKATISDSTVVAASPSSSATVGTYTIDNVKLAQAHQVYSKAVDFVDQPLGYDFTFYLGHDASRTASVAGNGGGTVAGVATADPQSGQKELGGGDYYVEVRKDPTAGSTGYQFRLVDKNNQAVSIADASDSSKFTTDWQTWAGADYNGGQGYDTGRGLKITFGADPTQDLPIYSAAKVTYTAQPTAIKVDRGDSLEKIRDTINSASYADGHGVQATIVNRSLVLTSQNTGTDGDDLRSPAPIGATPDALDADHLGLWSGADWLHEGQAAQDASFTVNNIQITRSKNTGLTDVLPGVTLDLKQATKADDSPITVSVDKDLDTIKSQIDSFVSQFNQVLNYLSAKTSLTKNSDGTYTRGSLAGDTVFGSLRINMMRDLMQPVSGLDAGDPQSLQAIGIKLDTGSTSSSQGIQLNVSDANALTEALTKNPGGALKLLNGIMKAVQGRLDTFSGTDGVLTNSAASLDRQITQANGRITAKQASLDVQEKMLTDQYSRLLAQLAQAQSDQYSVSVYMSYMLSSSY